MCKIAIQIMINYYACLNAVVKNKQYIHHRNMDPLLSNSSSAFTYSTVIHAYMDFTLHIFGGHKSISKVFFPKF